MYEERTAGPVAVVLAGLALAALVGVTTAPAHQAGFDTQVRITQYAENAVFLGYVRADSKACKRKRVVVLWQRRSGPDERIGRDRSNRSGLWGVAHPDARGTFYAKAKRRVIRRDGHAHVCKRDRSPGFSTLP